METRILRVSLLAAFAYLLTVSLWAQDMERIIEVKDLPPPSFESKLRASTEAWPDSTVRYTAEGERDRKTLYTYDENGNVVVKEYYDWISEKWVEKYMDTYEYDNNRLTIYCEYDYKDEEWGPVRKIEYFENDNTNTYSWEDNTWVESGSSQYFKNSNDAKVYFKIDSYYVLYNYVRTKFSGFVFYQPFGSYGNHSVRENLKYETKYDIDGKLIQLEWGLNNELDTKFVISYDESNNLSLVELFSNDLKVRRWIYKYDTDGILELMESHEWNSENGSWTLGQKYSYSYDSNGNESSYTWNGTGWDSSSKTIEKKDEQGNVSMTQTYSWVDGKWNLTYYTVYYPYLAPSDLEIETSAPVTTDNKGSFDIGLNMPEGATIDEGSLELVLPEGVAFDTEGSGAVIGNISVGGRILIVTDGMGSGTSFVRSSTDGSSYQKILTLAYTVDEAVKHGTYTAYLRSVNFKFSDGTHVIEEEVPVTIEVARFGSHTEEVPAHSVKVYASGNALTIDSRRAETIDIYILAGQRIYSATKPEGKYTINRLGAKGLLIVKGSSGWERKVLVE